MKRMLLAILIVVLAAGLSGCVRMYSTTDIKDDGSGTATIEIGMTRSVADAIQELQEIDPNAGGDQKMPSLSDINKAEIEKNLKPYNVKLTSFEKSDADSTESIKMTFAFQDLKGLSAAMGAATGETPEEGLGIYAAPDGNYVLKQATYDFSDFPLQKDEEAEAAKEPEEQPQPTPEQMQKQMAIMGKLMGALSELDVRMEITVPGDIVSTNAPEQKGRTSIWTINQSNMMTAGQDMSPVITFSGKGLHLKHVLQDSE